MNQTSKIITLIQHDLKNHQIAANVETNFRSPKTTNPDILDLVFKLMNVPECAEIDWGKTYCEYMNFAPNLAFLSSPKQLRSQAELCFKHLQCIIEVELKHQNSN